MTNTELWDSVYKTDPEHAKAFKKAGGFSGTAIKPYWLIQRATQTFGVCGIGWGWEEIENKYVAGVWCSKVRLWFDHNGKKGHVEQWGQTVMEGTNSKGNFVDEEAPKKAVTDAITKCLSYLGFAGDVHMGRFDDSKYVNERKAETAAEGNRRFKELCGMLERSGNPALMWTMKQKEIEEALQGEEPELVLNTLLKSASVAIKELIKSSDDPAVTWDDQIEILKLMKNSQGAQVYYSELVKAGAARKQELQEQSDFKERA